MIEIFFKGLNVFITPSQISILKTFFTAVTMSRLKDSAAALNTGKLMDARDFDMVQRQLDEQLSNQVRPQTIQETGMLFFQLVTLLQASGGAKTTLSRNFLQYR